MATVIEEAKKLLAVLDALAAATPGDDGVDMEDLRERFAKLVIAAARPDADRDALLRVQQAVTSGIPLTALVLKAVRDAVSR
jgi:hypothetical protein